MTTRDRSLLLAFAGVAVLAAFWFLALQPKRDEAQTLAGQITTQRDRLQGAQQTAAQGLQAKARYARDYATVTELGQAVPADDDIASLLYQLDSVSKGERVDFQSLVRTTGTASQPTPAPAATPPAGASSSSSSASSAGSSAGGAAPSSGAGATAAPAAAPATASLPPGATVGTAGLATLPFTFTFKGSFFGLQRLLGDVQGLVRSNHGTIAVRGRLLTVDGVSLTAGAKGLSKLEARLVATAYLSPPAQDPATGATTPSGATGSGSSGSASTGTPATSTSAITGGTN